MTKTNGFIRRIVVFALEVAAVWVIGSLLRKALPAYPVGIMTIFCINAVLALSWNLISGFTGQFSLGHAGFMVVGAYTSALLMMKAKWPFLPSFIAGGLLSALVGFLVGTFDPVRRTA